MRRSEARPALTTIGAMLTVLLLTNCADTTPEQRTQIAQLTVGQVCDAYSGALSVLAPQRAMGVLSVAEVQTINDLNAAVDPVCAPGSPPPADPTKAVTQVALAGAQAMAIFRSHEKGGL